MSLKEQEQAFNLVKVVNPCFAPGEFGGGCGQELLVQFQLVCQLQTFLEKTDLATVTHILVVPHLDYFITCHIWDCPWKAFENYNWFKMLWSGCWWVPHMTPVLWELHWLSICFGVQFKVLIVYLNLYMVWVLGILVSAWCHMSLPTHWGRAQRLR